MLIITTYLLFSQQLNLPTEDIIGQLSPTADSLSITKDYSNYYNFSQIERLQYKPVLEKKIDYRKTEKQHGYLYFNGALMKADARLGLYSQNTPELNIYGRYFMEEIDDYKATKMEIDWLPLNKYTGWNLQPGLLYKSGKHENMIVYDIETELTSFGVNLSAEPIQSNFFKLYTNYYKYNFQDSQKNDFAIGSIYELSNFDFQLHFKSNNIPYVRIGDNDIITETNLKIYNYYENFHASGDVYFDIPFIDLFALQIQYSDDFWPSLQVEQAFQIGDVAEISIGNRPFMMANSLFDIYTKHPFAAIRGEFDETKIFNFVYAEQTPWNAFITFSLFKESFSGLICFSERTGCPVSFNQRSRA